MVFYVDKTVELNYKQTKAILQLSGLAVSALLQQIYITWHNTVVKHRYYLSVVSLPTRCGVVSGEPTVLHILAVFGLFEQVWGCICSEERENER